MKCCVECFRDMEIRSRIERMKRLGHCNVCETENVFIYDTLVDTYLVDDFEAFLDTYKPESYLPSNYPPGQLRLLKDELIENWNIFNLDADKIERAIKAICRSKYNAEPELFEQKIGVVARSNDKYLEDYSILGKYSWNDFVESIKTQNRFHSRQLNTSVLSDFFEYLKKSYKKGMVFYRARISGESGFHPDDMGAPPPGIATAGRVNPEGISYLYLGSDRTTTLNEVRAGLHDFVTIAAFRLKEDMAVVNLTSIDSISVFSGLDPTLHAINRANLIKMNNDIAKPLRRQDSSLEYLPTQYICEFIKTIRMKDGSGYSGIEYKSTMNKSGYNIAIFDSSLFECIDTTVFDVQGLHYIVDPKM